MKQLNNREFIPDFCWSTDVYEAQKVNQEHIHILTVWDADSLDLILISFENYGEGLICHLHNPEAGFWLDIPEEISPGRSSSLTTLLLSNFSNFIKNSSFINLVLLKKNTSDRKAKVLGALEINVERQVAKGRDFCETQISINNVNRSNISIEALATLSVLKTKSSIINNANSDFRALQSNPLLFKNPITKLREAKELIYPPSTNMDRVGSHNKFNEQTFSENGKALSFKLANLYEAVSGKPIDETTSVLDWGCGCGKLYRHIKNTSCHYTGADIDPVNIAWCQENLKDADFLLLSEPQDLTVEKRKFDIVFSFSVMTHLDNKHQMIWLEALANVCNGYLILSFHSNSHTVISNPFLFNKLLLDGNLVSNESNLDISDVDQSKSGEYLDVANSYSNMIERFSNVVDIVAIVPGGSSHDWLVARPRKC